MSKSPKILQNYVRYDIIKQYFEKLCNFKYKMEEKGWKTYC